MATLSLNIDPRHIVAVRRVGELFMVEVEPDHPAHQPETFTTYRAARGFAGGIRLVNRWAIADHVEEDQRHG